MDNIYSNQESGKAITSSLFSTMYVAIAGTIVVSGFLLFIPSFGFWFYGIRDTPVRAFQSLVFLPWDHIYAADGRIVKRVKSATETRELTQTALIWWASVTAATGAGIASISYIKVNALRHSGGVSVAKSLGGVELCEGAQGEANLLAGFPERRRAVHVVAEMAIAAKLPQPKVFLLPNEQGINAFAVGSTVEDAVLGLTEGAIQHLRREELQAVVAHEFAHIVNGDMRSNLQMIGYLHGVYTIPAVAFNAIRTGREMVFAGQSEGGDDVFTDVVFGIPLLLVGLALWPCGLVGATFGAWVHSLFSREREFLADAFAVEFTRNPDAVASAMKRMAGHARGSLIGNTTAIECSHVFFACGYPHTFSVFRTHPPIGARILRVQPEWDGSFLGDDQVTTPATSDTQELVNA